MPAIWCEVHHLVPRDDGGCNGIDNLGLFCGFHHSFIHRHRLKVGFGPYGATMLVHLPGGIVRRGVPHQPPTFG